MYIKNEYCKESGVYEIFYKGRLDCGNIKGFFLIVDSLKHCLFVLSSIKEGDFDSQITNGIKGGLRKGSTTVTVNARVKGNINLLCYVEPGYQKKS